MATPLHTAQDNVGGWTIQGGKFCTCTAGSCVVTSVQDCALDAVQATHICPLHARNAWGTCEARSMFASAARLANAASRLHNVVFCCLRTNVCSCALPHSFDRCSDVLLRQRWGHLN